MKDICPEFSAEAEDDLLRDPDTVMSSTRFNDEMMPELDNNFPDVPQKLQEVSWKLSGSLMNKNRKAKS